MNRMDRRNWVWLPSRLRFRVLGLVDVVALWFVVAALLGTGTWWGLDTYWKHRDYCTADLQLRRIDDECVGVTAAPYDFAPNLTDVLGRIARENEWARKEARDSGKQMVSVAVVMPYTSGTGAAMSEALIRHSLQGAYIAQHRHNQGLARHDTTIQLLFANVGRNLDHWQTVADELKDRVNSEAPVVAAIGFPNSDTRTLASVKELAKLRIPAVSAVLSSREMEDDYLFKVSPSTDQLVGALKQYVSANELNREDTFLIADERHDNYVENLSQVFGREFGEEYGISPDIVHPRIGKYQGSKGPNRGQPLDFDAAVSAMCGVKAKTVFLAGRDADLPPFLDSIDHTASCDQGTADQPLRILRVSTGRDPETESGTMGRIADGRHIEIVTAAAVDAPRWRADPGSDQQVPRYFGRFAESYDRDFDEERTGLNDGYATMYHDALTAVSTAVIAARSHQKTVSVSHDDVYNALRRFNLDAGCSAGCVQGASGVFTFADEQQMAEGGTGGEAVTGQWPVCKPVPVVTFPQKSPNKSPLYRTYQKQGESICPPP